MKIAITGASGQFGRAAAEGLLAHIPAEDLILISRNPAVLADFAVRGVAVAAGDFDDPASLLSAMRGATRLLMISGTRVGFRETQHRNAVEAASAAGVRHIVYTSFIGTEDSNPSLAVSDHRFTEKLIAGSGLRYSFLRDAQYADAVRDAMAPNIVRQGRMLSVAGDGRMAFVWRDDCVRSAVAVLAGDGHEDRAYAITGPELLSYRDVAAMVSELSGRHVTFEETDEDGLYAMFDALGVPRQPVDGHVANGFPWNSDDMVSFEAAVRDGHFAILSDDVERLTGTPPRSLRDMLLQIREWK